MIYTSNIEMPLYCYTLPDGAIIEIQFPMGEAPDSIRTVGGDEAQRNRRAELSHVNISIKSSRPRDKWPMKCFASGVHPNQAGELRKFLRDRGCLTEVTPNGDVVYTSAAHRRKVLKLRGMFDKNAFY